MTKYDVRLLKRMLVLEDGDNLPSVVVDTLKAMETYMRPASAQSNFSTEVMALMLTMLQAQGLLEANGPDTVAAMLEDESVTAVEK